MPERGGIVNARVAFPVCQQPRRARQNHGRQDHPGQSGNPLGPRKGFQAGRQAAVALLDEILSEHETKARMKAALRAYILQRPVAAFKSLVMPLLPKDVRVDVSSQRVVVWRSFMEEMGTSRQSEQDRAMDT